MNSIYDAPYGADQNGLIWGYRFHSDGKSSQIDALQVQSFMVTPESERQGEFLWLHFSLSHSSSMSWIKKNFTLPDEYYETLQSIASSTRVEQDGDSLIAVINDVQFDFTLDSSSVASTSITIDKCTFISARLKPLRSLDKLRTAVRAGATFHSTVELLAHLLQDQADVLVDILRTSTSRVDQIEDHVLSNRVNVKRSELGNLRRVLVKLQRLLSPEPAALFRLLNRPPTWFTDFDTRKLKEAAEEFSVAVGDSIALAERIKLLQEELAASINEQANRTLAVLTIVTVLALPINLTSGLFGMNVGGTPFSENPFGFEIIATFLICITLLLAYIAFLRNKD
jgi:zinc transporter